MEDCCELPIVTACSAKNVSARGPSDVCHHVRPSADVGHLVIDSLGDEQLLIAAQSLSVQSRGRSNGESAGGEWHNVGNVRATHRIKARFHHDVAPRACRYRYGDIGVVDFT